MARVYAVASAKGGVGKTATASNLAAALAAADRRVAVVDADLGMANLGGVLGVDGEPALHDVLAGRATPEAAVHEGPAGISVVPGSVDLAAFADADPSGIRGTLEELADYDDVVVDTGAGLGHDSVLPMALADETLLVSTPDTTALADTTKTGEMVERLDGTVRGLVLTRTDTDPEDPAATDAADRVGTELLATIPEDPAVAAAAERGVPLTIHDPDGAAATAYRRLAAELAGLSEHSEGAAISGPEPDVERGAAAAAETTDGAEKSTGEAESPTDGRGEPEESATGSAPESAAAGSPAVEADPDGGPGTERSETPESVMPAVPTESVDSEDPDGSAAPADPPGSDDSAESAESAEPKRASGAEKAAESGEPEKASGAVEPTGSAGTDDPDESTESAEPRTSPEPSEPAGLTAPTDLNDSTDPGNLVETAGTGGSADTGAETSEDVLVPDAEADGPAAGDDTDPAAGETEPAATETALVEEAERLETPLSRPNRDRSDDDDDGEGGFFGRLLG